MTYWTIPVRNHEGCGSSSEDQYHQLKTERDELARKWNDTNEANRLLRTKCSRLQAIDRSNRTIGVPDKIQPDYDDLFKAYDKLQREHRALTTKHKSSIQLIGKLRNEIQTLKLRCAVPRQSCSTSARSKPIVCRGSMVSDQGNTDVNKENLINDQLQLRLNNAETQLQMFRRESVDAASKTQVRLLMMAQCLLLLIRPHLECNIHK